MKLASRKSALVSLSLILVASAFLRVALYAPNAWAAMNSITPSKSTTFLDTETDSCTPIERVEVAYDTLMQGQAEVAQKKQTLDQRARELNELEADIIKRVNELKTAQTRLEELVSYSKTAAQGDLNKLTEVYSVMKPKNAARLFEEMDSKFAAGFLANMPSESAANILANLSPNKAYSISAVLASRNLSAPTPKGTK